MNVSEWTIYVVSIAVIIAAWAKVLRDVDSIVSNALNDRAVQVIRNLLLGIKEGKFYRNVIWSFSEILDGYLGKSLLTLNSLKRSALLSTIAFLTLTISALQNILVYGISDFDNYMTSIIVGILFFLVVNIIIDYISMIKTL
jgi:hypothetical protein